MYRVQPAPGEAGDAVHHQQVERSRTRAGAARRGAARAGDVAARMIVLGHSRPMYIRTKQCCSATDVASVNLPKIYAGAAGDTSGACGPRYFPV